jgi:hypothetical protein
MVVLLRMRDFIPRCRQRAALWQNNSISLPGYCPGVDVTNTFATGLNGAGDVCGRLNYPGTNPYIPIVWPDGANSSGIYSSLTVPGFTSGQATAFNASGHIIGFAWSGSQFHVFTWSKSGSSWSGGNDLGAPDIGNTSQEQALADAQGKRLPTWAWGDMRYGQPDGTKVDYVIGQREGSLFQILRYNITDDPSHHALEEYRDPRRLLVNDRGTTHQKCSGDDETPEPAEQQPQPTQNFEVSHTQHGLALTVFLQRQVS